MKTCLLIPLVLASCQSVQNPKLVISVAKQQATLVSQNRIVKKYPVSTGAAGTGTKPGSGQTPTGLFQIVQKIGEGMSTYTGFKGNIPTRNVSGTDPIISRVLVIDGLEPHNKNTKARLCKIHGTPYINQIGKPVSRGCVRFKPDDIVNLCQYVSTGTIVEIK